MITLSASPRAWPRIHLTRVARLAGIIAAVSALQHVLGMAPACGGWAGWAQTVAVNAILAVGAAGAWDRRRPGAVPGDLAPIDEALRPADEALRAADDAVSIEQLAQELADVEDVAADLDLVACPALAADWKAAVHHLDAIRWILAEYVFRTPRTRRGPDVSAPAAPVGADGDGDGELAQARSQARACRDELFQQRHHTNVVVAKWLVAHRVTMVDPCYLDSNVLDGRIGIDESGADRLSGDPLYLLVCHLSDVLERAGESNADQFRHIPAQLTLPLYAVRQEMSAAMSHLSAAIDVQDAVDRRQAR